MCLGSCDYDPTTPKVVKDYEAFLKDSVTKRQALEQEQENFDEKDMRKDMFHYLIQAKDPNTGEAAYSDKELFAEANLLVAAGSDTTSVSICSILFNLTRNARVYKKLVREIRSTFQSADEICGGPRLSGCQYLRACIDESLRHTPVGGTETPRQAGPGGAVVDGEFYPEGTKLGIAAWSYYKNEEVFSPDPYTYRPERWIVDEENGVSEQDVARAQSASQFFSTGPGSCVGKNLAMLEILVTVARTLWRMDVRALPGDDLGAGNPKLGWGERNPLQYLLTDAYINVDRKGPVVQFKKRED